MAEANWYSDPEDPSRLRYWDGAAWTAHTTADPGAPISAFDAAARGIRVVPDVASNDFKITVDRTDRPFWSAVAAVLRSLVGGLIASALVGAVWFGINRFIADSGYMVFGLVSILPAMLFAAFIGFFASDRRERPGWAASMFATVLAAITFAVATNGALADYFDGPGGLFVSCLFGSTFAGVVGYGGKSRGESRGMVVLNTFTSGCVAFFVLVVVFVGQLNPIGSPGGSIYEDCRLLDAFTSSLDDGSQRERERAWNAFSTYVDDEMNGRVTSQLRDRMGAQVLVHAVDPDDEVARERIDELAEEYSDRHDC